MKQLIINSSKLYRKEYVMHKIMIKVATSNLFPNKDYLINVVLVLQRDTIQKILVILNDQG